MQVPDREVVSRYELRRISGVLNNVEIVGTLS